ncbi:MAG: TetR family transcriptional regulator, partial [Desulfobacterales bacterium]|nr:TetR family transcriptional regulator [Desulfobacterales bacterium]
GLQVIDYFIKLYGRQARGILNDHAIPPLRRLRRFMDEFKELFESMAYTRGCPVGNFAQEMGDLSPAFREKLKEAFDAMTHVYVGILEEAREAGDIPEHLDVGELAEFMIASWHGALIRMKVERSARPLETIHRFLFETILKK